MSGEPNAPLPQRPRADSQRAQDGENEEFRERHKFPAMATTGFPGLVDGRDLQHTTRFPVAGWPPRKVLSLMSDHNRFAGHPVFAIDFGNVPPNQSFVVGDPLLPSKLRAHGQPPQEAFGCWAQMAASRFP